MGNLVQKAVKIDPTTLSTSRGKYARVCVEIDFSKHLVPLISMLGHLQAVEYEGLYMIWFFCSEYGHREVVSKNCPGVELASEIHY